MGKYVIYVLLVVGLIVWIQTYLLLTGLGDEKKVVTQIRDVEIEAMVTEKTGVELNGFYISDSEVLFGMMVGLPGMPKMLLSSELYDTFTPSELEFVALHEVGHYQRGHIVNEGLVGFLVLVAGSLVLSRVKRVKIAYGVAIVMGVIGGLLMLQLGTVHEYQAERYMLSRVENPLGVVTAAEKFKANTSRSVGYYDRPWWVQKTFFRAIPYGTRIEMAKEEYGRREKTN